MPNLTFPENFRVTTATTGTGTLTLGSAVAQFVGSGALANGKSYPYTILDVNGTDWETGVGTYTASGTTLSRTPIASSNGNAAINLSATGSTVLIGPSGRQAQSQYEASRRTITGEMQFVDATHIGYSAGVVFIEAEDRAISFPAPANLTPTLAASTMYNLYGFLSSGTFTLESSTTAPTPFANPAGNRQSKTGDSTRAYLGSFFTDSSGNILPFAHLDLGGGQGEIRYSSYVAGNAPYRLLSAATDVAFVNKSAATVAPPSAYELYARIALLYVTTGAASIGLQTSLDGVHVAADLQGYAYSAGAAFIDSKWFQILPGTPSFQYRQLVTSPGAGPNLYLDATAYRFRR